MRCGWTRLSGPFGILALGACFGVALYGLPNTAASWREGWFQANWYEDGRLWAILTLLLATAEIIARLRPGYRPVPTSRTFRNSVRTLLYGAVLYPACLLFFLVHIAITAILNARFGWQPPATLTESLRCFL